MSRLCIQDDYDIRKVQVVEARSEIIQRLMSIQNRSAAEATELRRSIAQLGERNNELANELSDFRQKYDNDMDGLKTNVAELKLLIHQLAPGILQSLAAASTNPAPALSTVAAAPAPAELVAAAPAPAAPVVPLNAFSRLTMGSVAAAETSTQDFGKTSISEVLTALYKRTPSPLRHLKGHRLLSGMNYRQIESKNSQKYAAAMTLADALLTTAQRKMAILGTLSANDATVQFQVIDKWIMKATAALSGQSTVTSKRRAYWVGVGNTIKSKNKFGKDMTAFIKSFIPKTPWDVLECHDDDADECLAAGKNITFRQWVEQQLLSNT